MGSAKNRNVLYNCSPKKQYGSKKEKVVGQKPDRKEAGEKGKGGQFWMPTFTFRIVVIQVQ